MGGALGAGALGAVFTAALGDRLPAATVAALLDPRRRGESAPAGIGDALAAGLLPIFEVGAALGLAALVVSFFLPERRVTHRRHDRDRFARIAVYGRQIEIAKPGIGWQL